MDIDIIRKENTMLKDTENKTLGAKLKIIRNVYNLLGKDMAQIMGSTYRNYLKYEAEDMEPSANRLAKLSSYTGISMEWMMGISKKPYNKEFITEIEKSIWTRNKKGELKLTKNIIIETKNYETQIFPFKDMLIFSIYENFNERDYYYTLDARAQIIVLIRKYLKLIDSTTCFKIEENGDIVFDYKAIEKNKITQQLMEYGIGMTKK